MSWSQLMSRFSKIIEGVTPSIGYLPLIYTCDLYGLRDALEDKLILPTQCDVFTGKNLSYCFYGRPSNHLKSNGSILNQNYFPVCFIRNYANLPEPHEVYPFQTREFIQLKNIKEIYFHKGMDVSHFILGSELNTARAMVEKFYTTNSNYFDSTPTLKSEEIPVFNFEATSFLNFISNEINVLSNDRISNIQVIYNTSINLSNSTIENIILPQFALDNYDINMAIKNDLGIKNPLGYETFTGNPSEYHKSFVNIIRDYLTVKLLI